MSIEGFPIFADRSYSYILTFLLLLEGFFLLRDFLVDFCLDFDLDFIVFFCLDAFLVDFLGGIVAVVVLALGFEETLPFLSVVVIVDFLVFPSFKAEGASF